MILVLETASPTTRLWLLNPSAERRTSNAEPAPTLEWESGRQLADQLLGRIDELLKSKQVTVSDLTGIVIFSGPGSFTSLRIGHTTANALADSLGIPVAGAGGDDWLKTAIESPSSAKTGVPALPFYGAEANITRPKS